MVAAATTSLPERARQGRNYDYRYVWIRDQCYAGQAVAKAGPHPLDGRRGALRLRAAARGRPAASSPPTRPRGGRVPDQRALELPGYPGRLGHRRQLGQQAVPARRVRRGAAAVRRGRRATTTSTRRLARRGGRGRGDRAALAGAGHRRRDLGDRARRVDAQPADLRRRPAPDRRAQRPAASRPRAGSSLADEIVSDTAAHALHPFRALAALAERPASGRRAAARRRSAARSRPSDPRSIATLHAVEAELTQDGYCYRYRPDERPLGRVRGRVPAVRLL